MSASPFVYLLSSLLLFCLALGGLLLTGNLLRKLLALNVMATAVFLLLVAVAYGGRGDDLLPADPVPHAMVLTGIVVSFAASAMGVAFARRLHGASGRDRLPEEEP